MFLRIPSQTKRGRLLQSYALPLAFISLIIALGSLSLSGILVWQQDEGSPSSKPQIIETPQSEASVEPKVQAPEALQDLNARMIELAEKVKPTVVTVSTERVLEQERRSPFGGFPFGRSPFDDFFEDFFGGPDQRQREPREFRQSGLGSGVILSSDGYILTNQHVVANADTISVTTHDNRNYDAEVIGGDDKTDIAVIKIDANNLTSLPHGDSDQLRVGEMVFAVGSPMSPQLAHTITQGIVSAKGRTQVGLADYEDFIQTDAAINPGNSGGALVNLDGELVGINTAIATRSGGFQGIGFAIPINMAKVIMDSLLEHGKVVRGWLGVSIQNIDENIAEAMGLDFQSGALVAEVLADSPADEAGLQEGDIIVELDGQSIENISQLRNTVAATAPGTEVSLRVFREGDYLDLQAQLEELSEDEQELLARRQQENSEKYEELFNRIGFQVASISDDLHRHYELPDDIEGVVVTDVSPRSNAARAGLRVGDVIRAVNREEVKSLEQFAQRIEQIPSGNQAFLHVYSDGNSRFLAFPL